MVVGMNSSATGCIEALPMQFSFIFNKHGGLCPNTDDDVY